MSRLRKRETVVLKYASTSGWVGVPINEGGKHFGSRVDMQTPCLFHSWLQRLSSTPWFGSQYVCMKERRSEVLSWEERMALMLEYSRAGSQY